MRQVLPLLTLGIALALLAGGTRLVHADDVVMLGDAQSVALQRPAQRLMGGPTVDDAVLSGQRGGADTHISEIRAVGSMSEVSVSDAVTGYNLITEGAFANANMMGTVVQNSGNGVMIQNAVILNLEVK
ncbi:hypothetical protein [Aromatoleum aromaticum]|uniref:Uncharacterized protein n=1 Tax=Aromatoleum aromaticum (strain DSM 19018 / LMG 30748 / EbN1) TaxID=76114 RepID=Q5P1P1_AROAE|nr:hypothetical protein [Aromatoleum aromaticum]NMG53284.1 hypothetical protein [Aromatoleum aromaticum]CAI08773.1 hypothetical protein ebB160 [Aromatoleum aromaticum EbN1]